MSAHVTSAKLHPYLQESKCPIFWKLQSFVGEMLMNNNQGAMADAYGLTRFNVRVLEPTRTLCEKIMSVVRFSHGENPIDDLKR